MPLRNLRTQLCLAIALIVAVFLVLLYSSRCSQQPTVWDRARGRNRAKGIEELFDQEWSDRSWQKLLALKRALSPHLRDEYNFQVIGNGHLVLYHDNSSLISIHRIMQPGSVIDEVADLHIRTNLKLQGYSVIGQLAYVNRAKGKLTLYQLYNSDDDNMSSCLKVTWEMFIHRSKNILAARIVYTNLKGSSSIKPSGLKLSDMFDSFASRPDKDTFCVKSVNFGDICGADNFTENHTIELPPKSSQTLTFVLSFDPPSHSKHLAADFEKLLESHESLWEKDSSIKMYVEETRAPGQLNQKEINRTLYYLTATSRYSPRVPSQFYHCYSHHTTIQAKPLWTEPKTLIDMNRLLRLWSVTMDKHRCAEMFNSGSGGRQLAVLLSVWAIRVLETHTEVNFDPDLIWRRMEVRGIPMGGDGIFDLEFNLDDDYKPVVAVSLTNSSNQAFVAGGGCETIHPLVDGKAKEIDIYITLPPSSILYISRDRTHLLDLQQTLLVHTIRSSDSVSHATIALHRHGHTYGGLPVYFWMCITALILTIHILLVNFVRKEFLKGRKKNILRESHNTRRLL